jgi:sigma-B regulation protein RsbU (phosphoserine phosphatase)
MSIKTKITLISLGAITLCTIILSVILYYNYKSSYYQYIDEKLKDAAAAFSERIPPEFINKMLIPKSVSQDEFLQQQQLLSIIAKENNVAYVYCLTKLKNDIHFALISEGNDTISYFTRHPTPPASLVAAFNSAQPTYAEYEDSWGTFRSIFIHRQTDSGTDYLIGADFLLDDIIRHLRYLIGMCSLIGLTIMLVVGTLTHLILSRTTKPISTLTKQFNSLAKQNFILMEEQKTHLQHIAHAPATGLAELAGAYLHMNEQLLEHIEQLKTTTAEKERVQSELDIARQIQHSFLPDIDSNIAQNDSLDVFGYLKAAREVGGDLYHFYPLDEKTTLIAIGDVSGKGIPAALFMAVVQTLLPVAASQCGNNPAKILFFLNEELIKHNKQMMFVTLFIGLINTQTGECIYSSAGHNPPVIKTSEEVYPLPLIPALPLGVFLDAEYENRHFVLDKASTLFLYTDGVTEEQNRKQELFTLDRLLKTLDTNNFSEAHQICSVVASTLAAFREGEKQYDDIAMLGLIRPY